MKIIIELDHAVNEFEAQEMVENFNNEPWVTKAYLDKGGCGSCKKSVLCKNSVASKQEVF